MNRASEIDKTMACRQLVHSCIRLIFSDKEPLLVHLGATAAYDLLRALAKAKNAQTILDLESLIRPDMRRFFFKAFKYRYNFLKHSDLDPDARLSFEGIRAQNDLLTIHNVSAMRDIFGIYTRHFLYFAVYTIQEYGSPFAAPVVTPEVEAITPDFSDRTREERLADLADMLANDPEAQREHAEDVALFPAHSSSAPH